MTFLIKYLFHLRRRIFDNLILRSQIRFLLIALFSRFHLRIFTNTSTKLVDANHALISIESQQDYSPQLSTYLFAERFFVISNNGKEFV